MRQVAHAYHEYDGRIIGPDVNEYELVVELVSTRENQTAVLEWAIKHP